MKLRVLYAAAEMLPFAKTGGLGDVAQALPQALAEAGAEVRAVCPAYPGALGKLREPRQVAVLDVLGESLRVWEGQAGEHGLRVWLIECATLFERPGTPYQDAGGADFADNAWRFGCWCRALAQLARGAAHWQPQVLHLNDWQTGLVPAFLEGAPRPRIVFTIHNLAYQGVYERREFDALGVPLQLWHPDGIEFYGRGSFIKAGIALADRITTVSPTYAREIQTPEQGHGLDGLLRHRAARLTGILNGIDVRAWDPRSDAHLAVRYGADDATAGKAANRHALRAEFGLDDDDSLLLGVVSRLAHQKGVDLLPEAWSLLADAPLQVALLGSGERALEERLRAWAAAQPRRAAVRIGHDERLAHRIEAGADAFLMASRYEPCGLNQMYSQRYGTVPIVRRAGGLADSVTDATPAALADGSATGIVFEQADAAGIAQGLRRALAMYGSRDWRRLQAAGMARDFSWQRTAHAYLSLYA